MRRPIWRKVLLIAGGLAVLAVILLGVGWLRPAVAAPSHTIANQPHHLVCIVVAVNPQQEQARLRTLGPGGFELATHLKTADMSVCHLVAGAGPPTKWGMSPFSVPVAPRSSH